MAVDVSYETESVARNGDIQRALEQAWAAAVQEHEYDFPSILRQFVVDASHLEGVLPSITRWPGDKTVAQTVKCADEKLYVLDGLEVPELAVILFHEAAFLKKNGLIAAEKE